MSLNKFMAIGNLAREIELKYTPNGSAVANFAIAMNEKYKDKSGQMQEKVEFINVVIWGKQAENCNQYLSKGSKVFIEGKVSTRSWDDKDGKKRYTTEIIANNIQFLDSKKDASLNDNSYYSNKDNGDSFVANNNPGFVADDIPF